MPWKGEKDPYRIWLSEVILQQTRVEQGWEYYNRFVTAFPTIRHLARASETTVFKMWEGLGYYTRCKNLISTAAIISKEKKGKFPDTYEEILALKGVGPYTAAAISSFAFNLPHAVVDGNVFRVLARYFGIHTPIDTMEGKNIFSALAHELMDKKQPGLYNQAIMDFGAVSCKPQLPLCTTCPLKSRCVAYQEGAVNKLPVKEKKAGKKNRWFNYLVVECKGKIYVRKRGKKDIWENLYEFILAETTAAMPAEVLMRLPAIKKMFGKSTFEITKVSESRPQQLTHQTIRGQFIRVALKKPLKIAGYEAVEYKQLKILPFPKLITAYLTENRQKAFER